MANLKYFKGTETTILGHKVSTPMGVAPVDFQQIFDPIDGEVSVALAAKELGSIYTVSALSNKSIEEIASRSQGGPKFF